MTGILEPASSAHPQTVRRSPSRWRHERVGADQARTPEGSASGAARCRAGRATANAPTVRTHRCRLIRPCRRGVGALVVAAVNRPAVVVPENVRDIAVGEASHVEGDVTYETTPGAGGPHSGAWQNCGVYTEPVAEENAVHSMEHGAVWLSYRPDLDQTQVQRLAELGGQDYVVVSPLADLPASVVATAWGKQLTVESANDPALEAFVRSFAQGPQTLERGAPCTGGIGEPA